MSRSRVVHKQRRDQWIESQGGCCKQCGSSKRLEVDHIDPDTKDPILKGKGCGAIWDWKLSRREAELAKCRVLCHLCASKKYKKNTKPKLKNQIKNRISKDSWMRDHGNCIDCGTTFNLKIRYINPTTMSEKVLKHYTKQGIARVFQLPEEEKLVELAKCMTICQTCLNSRNGFRRISPVERNSKRRAQWFSENGPCKSCGSSEDLELDHIDPSTKDPALKKVCSHIWNWAEERRKTELAKCQVLCKKCHMIKTGLELTKITDPERYIIDQNALQKRRSRRKAWILENGPCTQCKSWDDLEVDHIDPSTKDPILKGSTNTIWSWGDERRSIELKKCHVLCKKCHRGKTNLEHTKPIVHRTLSGYYKGCRDECCVMVQRNHYRKIAERKHCHETNGIKKCTS